MKKVHEIINETLENLNNRQVQGIAAINLMNYVIEQLFAIGKAVNEMNQETTEAKAESEAPAEAEQ